MDSARAKLTRFARLSIATALATIVLKTGAWWLTGSVGLLSDAVESVVNLAAAVAALIALVVSARPPDERHQFGHAKAEYFSAVIEGVMIFVAAALIIYAAVDRLLNERALEHVGVGLAVSVVAAAFNAVVASVLVRAGRAHRSITLEADGKHLLTDVWTSVGVVAGVLLVALTGWERLDPLIAILVGLNILWTGWHLISRSVGGLMDSSLDRATRDQIAQVLQGFAGKDVQFHAVRTREAGHLRVISMHVLVPATWTVRQGHDLTEEVEDALHQRFVDLVVETHVEPIGDPRAHKTGLTGLAIGDDDRPSR